MNGWQVFGMVIGIVWIPSVPFAYGLIKGAVARELPEFAGTSVHYTWGCEMRTLFWSLLGPLAVLAQIGLNHLRDYPIAFCFRMPKDFCA